MVNSSAMNLPNFICTTIYACFFFCICTSASTNAQHCPFDRSGAIVISARNAVTDSIIDGLEIFLCDSLGHPYRYAPRENGQTFNFDCQFHQNPQRTTFQGYIDNNHPADPLKIRFPFAGRDYLMICSRGYSCYKAYVKLIDPLNRYHSSSVIKLVPEDVYPLCGNYDEPEYRDSRIPGRRYQPAIISLYPVR